MYVCIYISPRYLPISVSTISLYPLYASVYIIYHLYLLICLNKNILYPHYSINRGKAYILKRGENASSILLGLNRVRTRDIGVLNS